MIYNSDPWFYFCDCLCGYPCHPAQILGLMRQHDERVTARMIEYLRTPLWGDGIGNGTPVMDAAR